MREVKFNIPPIHIHLHGLPSDAGTLGRIEKSLGLLCAAATASLKNEGRIMSSVDDILAKSTAVMAQVKATSDTEDAIIALVQHNNDVITDLKNQLANAGTDPGKLQQLSDAMDAILASETANTTKVADAVTANTTTDPAPAPTQGQ